MYKHWYVAQINQLSNKETAVFLSSLELLENTRAATRLRECALIELERHFDLNLQIYSLPTLIKVALSQEADSTLNEKAIWLIREICAKTNNKKAIEFAKCLEKREQLLILLQNIDSGRTSQKKMLESDYIDLNAYVETIMALGIFRQLSTEEVESLLDQGDNWTSLLRSAVEGYCGRYCIVLASEVISCHQISLLSQSNIQISSFSPVFYAQPDLLYSWLSLHVAEMSADECIIVQPPYNSRKAASNKSVQNAMTWLFRGRKSDEIKKDEYYDAINQLWNYSLWILAIRKAIRDDNLYILADSLSNQWRQGRKENGSSTPWIHRKYAKYDKRSSSDINNPEYPSMKEQAGAMKSALAMPIVSLLISHLGQVIPDFIIDLSLELNDVYACPGVRGFIDKGSFDNRDYSYVVVSLLTYAKETSEQIGKGYYNPIIPKLYTKLISEKARSIFCNEDIEIEEQERFLHSGASIMSCAYFAYEEASGTIPNTNKVRFWLEDENNSLAAQITQIALNEFCLYLNNNAEYNGISAYQVLEKAILLAYERFPNQITDVVKNNLKMRDSERGLNRDLIYTPELLKEQKILNEETKRSSYVYPLTAELLIENHTAAEWAGASIELPKRNEDSERRFSQRLMTLTRKLTRIVNVSEELGDDSYSYLERWTGTIASFYKNEEFSRVHRYMTTELLKELLTTNAFERINPTAVSTGTNRGTPPTDARDIAQVILETILELSRDAIFYQHCVGEIILQSDMNQRETLDNLKCVFFAMILEQCLGETERQDKLIFPCDYMEKRDTIESKLYLLLSFIRKNSPKIQNDAAFRVRLAELAKKICLKDAIKVNVGIEPDRITLTGDVQWKFESKSWREDNNYWDPDTIQCAKRKGTLSVPSLAIVRDKNYVPVERNYVLFLIEKAYSDNPIKMTLIEYDGTSVLASTSPGFNYRLPAEFWEQGSLLMMAEDIERSLDDYEIASPYGIYIDVTVVEREGLPVLQYQGLAADNLAYRDLFKEDESYSKNELDAIPTDNNFSDIITCRKHSESNYYRLSKGGWGIMARRKGEARFEQDTAWRSLRCQANEQEKDVIDRLLSLGVDKIITLSSIIHNRINEYRIPSFFLGFTEEGAKIQVDSDSVSLEHYSVAGRIENVKAIITDMPKQDYKKPNPNGVIWSIGADSRVEIKYIDGKSDVKTLETTLDASIRGVYCGIPVCVQGDRFIITQYNDKRWIKGISARRLWELEERNGNVEIAGHWQVYIGEYFFSNSDTPVYLVQDFNAGKLIAFSDDMKEKATKICGIEINSSRALATKIYRRKYNADIIKCVQDDKVYYGEAESGLFPPTEVQYKSVTVRLEEYYDKNGGKQYYDVHRVFADPVIESRQLDNGTFVAKSAVISQNERLINRYMEDFLAWSQNEKLNLHIEGKLEHNEAEDRYYFKPVKPLEYVPVDFEKPSIDDLNKWVNSIPIKSGELEPHPRLRKRPFALASVRWTDDGVYADTENTERFDINAFQKWISLKYPNQIEYDHCPLFFVKQDGEDLVFEWGVGLRLNLDKKHFHTGDSMQIENLLFYGDAIKKYRIIRMNNHLSLVVASMHDYEMSLEHRVKLFVQEGGKIFVEVLNDKNRNRVSTESITIRNRTTDMGIDTSGWSVERFTHGLLDDDAERIIRRQLHNGGHGYILAKPKWDSNLSRMRYHLADVEVGDVLCLSGGNICQNPGGNDYYVPFTFPFMPDEFLSVSGNEFEVRVTRRRFSYNESTLRTHFLKGNLSAFKSAMLVRVTDKQQDNLLLGDIRSLGERDKESVIKWLSAEQDNQQYVVIGEQRRNGVKVEIRPGIFCIAAAGTGSFDSGATGRLYLKKDRNGQRSAIVDVISDSDKSFCQQGRTVELLLINQYALEKPEGPHFTVAGLPAVHLTNQALGEKMIRSYPPRYGVLKNNNSVEEYCGDKYGYLKVDSFDGRERISFYKQGRRSPEQYIQFNNMSFLDGSVFDLIKHISRGEWHYHDQSTTVRADDDSVKRVRYRQNSNLPVLFSDNWSLRYKHSELAGFVFPPHEIEEFGLPENQNQEALDYYYPIAGKEDNAIYIELLPGRIVKLPLKLLQIDFVVAADGVFHTDTLAVGDMIKLASREKGVGKPTEISILDVKYGIKSVIEKDAYLKFQKYTPGCVVLGNAAFQLRFPSFNRQLESPVLCLTSENVLRNLRNNDFPQKGDIVTVECDDNGNLKAVGFNDAEVSLAADGTTVWKKGFWLKDILKPKYIRTALDVLGKGLLMRVECVDCDTRKIEVSYPQPDDPKQEEVLCAQIIGRHSTRLFLRSGMRLFTFDIAKSLNISERLANKVLDGITVQGGKNIWFRFDNQEYKIGLKKEEKELFQVKIISPFESEEEKGYLCENIQNHEWLWMPLENVARAKNATPSSVLGILREYYCGSGNKNEQPIFTVKRDQKFHASWLMANGTYQKKFSEMSCHDSANPINVKLVEELSRDNNIYTYLCCERPRGNIYQIKSEKARDVSGATSFISAVCNTKEGTFAELIPLEEMRTQVLLSRYCLESIRKGFDPNNTSAISKWDEIRSRYLNAGELENRLINYTATTIDFMSEGRDIEDTEYSSLLDDFKKALFDYIDVKPDDVPVLVAFAIAVYAASNRSNLCESIFAVIKQEADLYCCEEILLSDWLCKQNNYESTAGLFRILNRLDLRGKSIQGTINHRYLGRLLPEQLDDVVQLTNVLLRRTRVYEQSDIRTIVFSLRYSLDRKPNIELEKEWKRCLFDCFRNDNESFAQWKDSGRMNSMYNNMMASGKMNILSHICVHNSAKILSSLSEILR